METIEALSNHDKSVAELASLSMDTKLTIEFEYDGEPRLVEVHAIGLSKTGKPVIRGYQIDGGSISGETPGWKLFSIGKIFEFPKILDIKASSPRVEEGYVPGDKGMAAIFKELTVD